MIKTSKYFADITWRNKEGGDSTDYINSDVKSKRIGKFNLLFPPNCRFITSENRIIITKRKTNHSRVNTSLKTLLYSTIKKRACADCVLVSGGLDSSLLAKIMQELKRKPLLISCGFPDSEDIKAARYLEKTLQTSIEKVIITENSLLSALKTLKKTGMDEYNCMLGVVEFLSAETAKRMGAVNIMSGLGSDELFLGFNVHRQVEPRAIRDFVSKRLYYMHAYDLLRLNRISKIQQLDINLPYLDRRLINFALSHCNENEFGCAVGKNMLREVARDVGLPVKIVERKKRAMQYGSGVIEAMRRITSKKRFKNVGELIKYI